MFLAVAGCREVRPRPTSFADSFFQNMLATSLCRAKTTGWVGFGLTSNPGRMFPADVALAWVDENGGHLVDAASSQYNLPRPGELGCICASVMSLLGPFDPFVS